MRRGWWECAEKLAETALLVGSTDLANEVADATADQK
jgi:hypothetical protein